MSVPDFQSLMRPLLAVLEDGSERPITDIRQALGESFALSPTDLQERIPSGRVTTLQNRVGWAATYLYRTGLISRPKRAVYLITDRGRQVLEQNPDHVDLTVLSQFPEFDEFRKSSRETPDEAGTSEQADTGAATPEERIERASQEVRSALAAELLDRVLEQDSSFFEDLVLDVLQAMEYGGSRDDAARRLGQGGDGGVDGVIREDRLGLDLIYVQAKRWTKPVGRPHIQGFVGALQGQRASKGVFITTSAFSREAREYAEGVTPRVILVDGKELAQLMIDFGVGVTVSRQYEVKGVDTDYFVVDGDGAEERPDATSG